MSTLQPIVDIPFPNFPMDEETAPDRVDPVPEVTATTTVRAVEAPENRVPGEEILFPDTADLSPAGRRLAETAANDAASGFDAVANAESIRNNLGIRQLIASFDNYDNQAAQRRFARYLQLFASYAATPAATGQNDATLAALREREDELYSALGFIPGNVSAASTPIEQRMAVAIDNWLRGSGVFLPSMLQYSSSDGFRFSPLTDASRASLRAAEALASYERTRVAQYLREMSALTPEDFVFYDPTGLGELPLQQRRQFLERMDQLLQQANIDARAADLRYAFDEEGRLRAEELGLRNEEEIRRLEVLEEVINSYYGMLAASVRQYRAGIISASMG